MQRNRHASCIHLKTVSGGDAVTTIGGSAFKGCKGMEAFTIGAKVQKIGASAFENCSALKTLTIKSKVLKKSGIGKNCVKKIHSKAKIKCPKGKKKSYETWFRNPGNAPKKATFTQ